MNSKPLALATAIVLLAAPGATLAQVNDRQASEYAVYSAVLRQVVLAEGWAGQPRGERRPVGRLLVFSAPQGGWALNSRSKARLPTLQPETAEDFASNTPLMPLERRLDGVGAYEIITRSDLEALGPLTRDWSAFYDRFPDAPGVVFFSRVGLNRAHTQALVKMTHTRAGLWAHITLYLLEKSATGWQIIGIVGIGAA